MPGPMEFLRAFASGLDPREVWNNTTDTVGQVLEHLDRPRAAVKASQVESQDAGSFFDMLYQGLMGAPQGFMHPQNYPAEGFLESVFTDPLTYLGVGQSVLGVSREAGNPTAAGRWLAHILKTWDDMRIDQIMRQIDYGVGRKSSDALLDAAEILDQILRRRYGQ